MDRQTAEYYRRMADFRKKEFQAEELSSLGKLYESNYTQYYKQSLEQENTFLENQEIWNDIVARAREAQLAGKTTIPIKPGKGKPINVRDVLDEQGNARSLDDVVKSQRWYSTSQGKMMPGRLGKIAEELQMAGMDLEESSSSYKKYKQLYEQELSALTKRNEQRKAEFYKQKQETLAQAEGSAYRGASYVEKPL